MKFLKYAALVAAIALYPTSFIIAQDINLVPNPSFEVLEQCPTLGNAWDGDIDIAVNWSAANQSKQYVFHACSEVRGIPGNGVYYQYPRTGSAMVMARLFLDYSIGPFPLPHSQGLQVELKETLKKGKVYYAEFYLNVDNNIDPTYMRSVQMAFYESYFNEHIDMDSKLPIEADIDWQSEDYITDTVGWTRVNGQFIAEGNERYGLIANLNSLEETDVMITAPNVAPNVCDFFIDDVALYLFDPLPDTIYYCSGDEYELRATFLDATYEWSNGSTDSITTFNAPGVHRVTATVGGVALVDSVVFVDMEQDNPLPQDTVVCREQPVELYAVQPGNYIWSTGSEAASITPQETGNYTLTVDNECGSYEYETYVTIEECQCEFYIPTAFSPNDDGMNDFFEVYEGCDYPYRITTFEVYDRWGNQVYRSEDKANLRWDGSYKGEQLQNGVYTWQLVYEVDYIGFTTQEIRRGDVTITQ